MSIPTASRFPTFTLVSKLRRLALPIIVSVVLHGVLWRMCQGIDLKPEKPQETVIEATLIKLPKPVAQTIPATVNEELPAPLPPKPVSKKPEKPKFVAKPKPVVAAPKPQPEPQQAAETKSEAVPPTSQVTAPPIASPPAPEPITEATEIGGTLRNIAKHYPSIALQRGWEGKVILEVQILANGTTGHVKVLEGSGHDILDEAAIEAVKEAPWNPSKKGTKPIDSIRKLPIVFKIKK